jgi:hypothetical protein
MIQNIIRHFHDLLHAEKLIADLRLRQFAARTFVKAFAGLVAVFGLVMLNLACFFAIENRIGNVWAAGSVGAIDFVVAGLLMLGARTWPQPRELKLATEIQDSAMEGLAGEARQIQEQLAAVRSEITAIRTSLSNVAKHPLDEALRHLIVPLAAVVARSFERKGRRTNAD